MDRRKFLRWFGVGAAASLAVKAMSEAKPVAEAQVIHGTPFGKAFIPSGGWGDCTTQSMLFVDSEVVAIDGYDPNAKQPLKFRRGPRRMHVSVDGEGVPRIHEV